LTVQRAGSDRDVGSFQAYLRAAAARTHDAVHMPPFALFFNPNDSLRFYNYAIPLEPIDSVAPETLAALRAEFARRQRLLRFEFIRQYAPHLAPALAAAGLTEEGENPMMVCTHASFRPAPAVPGLEIRRLAPGSRRDDLAAFISVQGQSFGEDDRVEPTDAQVEDLRRRSGQGSRCFLALVHGRPVAAGAHTVPIDGFTELVGIATLPEYRRRGIATALTASMAQAAFRSGVQVAFLGAADERAGRVYERAGFLPYATALAYSDP
jgi:ribosomal protein S18 acetylase RimI-like enzyme